MGRGRSITSIQPMIRARRQTEIHQHDFANGTHVVWNRVCYASLDSAISRWAPLGSDRRGAYLHIDRMRVLLSRPSSWRKSVNFCRSVRRAPVKLRTEVAMSELGQNEKVSQRAFLDRCTPESGRSFAPRRTAAPCHKATYAVQQTASIRSPRLTAEMPSPRVVHV